jgi:hypothetical protein
MQVGGGGLGAVLLQLPGLLLHHHAHRQEDLRT